MINQIYGNELSQINITISFRGEMLDPQSPPSFYMRGSNSREDASRVSSLDSIVPVTKTDVGRYSAFLPPSMVGKMRNVGIYTTYTLDGFGLVESRNIYDVHQRVILFDEYNGYATEDFSGDKYELSYSEWDKAETLARMIIESFCSQPINSWYGTQQVSSPRSFIPLPQRLERLDSLSVVGEDPGLYSNSDFVSEFVINDIGDSVLSKSPVRKPSLFYAPSEENVLHSVTGLWGFSTIPDDIKRSGYELIRYFSSDESDERFRYKNSYSNTSRNSDTDNVTINFEAYKDSTGNPVVDALLDKYRISGMRAV